MEGSLLLWACRLIERKGGVPVVWMSCEGTEDNKSRIEDGGDAQ